MLIVIADNVTDPLVGFGETQENPEADGLPFLKRVPRIPTCPFGAPCGILAARVKHQLALIIPTLRRASSPSPGTAGMFAHCSPVPNLLPNEPRGTVHPAGLDSDSVPLIRDPSGPLLGTCGLWLRREPHGREIQTFPEIKGKLARALAACPALGLTLTGLFPGEKKVVRKKEQGNESRAIRNILILNFFRRYRNLGGSRSADGSHPSSQSSLSPSGSELAAPSSPWTGLAPNCSQ